MLPAQVVPHPAPLLRKEHSRQNAIPRRSADAVAWNQVSAQVRQDFLGDLEAALAVAPASAGAAERR